LKTSDPNKTTDSSEEENIDLQPRLPRKIRENNGLQFE